jgi:hypothetical protein
VTDCWSGAGPQPVNAGYTFRDGVTVRLKAVDGVCDGDPDRLRQQSATYFDAEVVTTTRNGPSRITMLTRQDYQKYFGGELPGRVPGPDGEVPWLRLVRQAHMDALNSTSHVWLDRIVMEQFPADLRGH